MLPYKIKKVAIFMFPFGPALQHLVDFLIRNRLALMRWRFQKLALMVKVWGVLLVESQTTIIFSKKTKREISQKYFVELLSLSRILRKGLLMSFLI